MKIHSLSSIFPKLDDVSFKALKQDIYANGLRNPIIIKNNEVIDGQNRLRACEELGIEPTFQEYEGDDLVEFVLAQNLHRRHLTAGQSATIVALAQDWSLAHQIGKKPKSNIINDLQQESYSAILPIKGLPLDAKVDTQADRAEKSGASVRTQGSADKLVKENPELAMKVATGEVSLNQAIKEIEPEKEKSVEDSFDVVHAYEQEVAENQRLQSIIEALTGDDKDKAIVSMSERIKGLEGRLNQALATEAEAIKQSKHYSKMLTSIRKLLAVDNNNDILIRIKGMK
jgi:ParB-like chromosome segregation protein Spo0J